MGAHGGNKQRITGVPGGFYGDWAPHGRRLVFSRSAPAADRLYVYSFATGSSRPVRTPDGSYVEIVGGATWSPDGHRIAFAHCDCDNDNSLTEDLFTIRPSGEGLRQITFTPHTNEDFPNWSPSGARLLYNGRGYHSNCAYLATIRADGSAQAQGVHAGCKVGLADWSPNGSKLVAYRYGKPRHGLWIMNVDGSHRRFLVPGENPDWQPRR
jgi:TolB protein